MSGRVRFGDFILDFDTRELHRAGEAIALTPKAFQLLSILIANRPKAMSKADLQAQLWPDAFVVDKNLANLVGETRDALDDDAMNPRFIRTVQKFGYAFHADAVVEETSVREELAQSTARVRLVWAGGGAALGEGEHVVGRDADLALSFASSTVSRNHALIRISGTQAWVEDLGSKNGTFVGEQRIHTVTPVADGDTVRVGSVTLRVQVIDASGSTATLISPRPRE